MRGRGRALPFPDASFDALTVTYLLRYVDDPAATLRELARVVRPGGIVAGLEFGVPPLGARPARRGASTPAPCCRRPASSWAGRPWWRAGRFLHQSIPDFYERHPLPALLDLYRAAGLDDAARAASELRRRGGHLGHGGIPQELTLRSLATPL